MASDAGILSSETFDCRGELFNNQSAPSYAFRGKLRAAAIVELLNDKEIGAWDRELSSSTSAELGLRSKIGKLSTWSNFDCGITELARAKAH